MGFTELVDVFEANHFQSGSSLNFFLVNPPNSFFGSILNYVGLHYLSPFLSTIEIMEYHPVYQRASQVSRQAF